MENDTMNYTYRDLFPPVVEEPTAQQLLDRAQSANDDVLAMEIRLLACKARQAVAQAALRDSAGEVCMSLTDQWAACLVACGMDAQEAARRANMSFTEMLMDVDELP